MTVTYEDIQKANETIQSVTLEKTNRKTGEVIKKEYAEVNQRIKAFRMVYPTGCIQTEMLSNDGGVCVFRCAVGYTDDTGNRITLGIGHAYEREGSTFINKTSYIENCETSAVGRALGMAGFGIDTSMASAEEVQTAMINQEAAKHISALEVKALEERCKKDGVEISKIMNLYKVASLKSLTHRQFSNINENWDKIRG